MKSSSCELGGFAFNAGTLTPACPHCGEVESKTGAALGDPRNSARFIFVLGYLIMDLVQCASFVFMG